MGLGKGGSRTPRSGAPDVGGQLPQVCPVFRGEADRDAVADLASLQCRTMLRTQLMGYIR